MIKIECPEDLRVFQNKPQISPVIVRYITNYLHFFLEEYHCPDMREFGAFFLLENKKDSLRHVEMGLSLPLEQSLPEFTDILHIHDLHQQAILLHSCFVLNDSYAISVFREPGVLKNSIEHVLLMDSSEKTINLEKGVF